jgi:hypothetical protein
MSERMFRAVVAAVLIGALALATVVAVATLYKPTLPAPSPSPVPTRTPSPAPSPTATPFSGPAFRTPDVVSVGLVARGASSDETLVLAFVESRPDAVPNAPGSFVVRLADRAGDPSGVAFTGTPQVVGPGSLGVTVTLAEPNVLRVDIVAADTFNVEALTSTGLGTSAGERAAVGPLTAEAGDFAGSLQGGFPSTTLPSPGSVVEPP